MNLYCVVLNSNINDCSINFKTYDVEEKTKSFQKINGGKPIKKEDIEKFKIIDRGHDKLDIVYYSLSEFNKDDIILKLKNEMRNHYRHVISESERAFGNVSRIKIKGMF
ncbi:hypothetical protein GCM10023310_69920 [Paenibacillus vulneris]|uniref:Uncharacterized protein n=1 Tax=Paenibacillus vulneris TaxID=1133364 RepID=A0ABW3UJ68_9BACL